MADEDTQAAEPQSVMGAKTDGGSAGDGAAGGGAATEGPAGSGAPPQQQQGVPLQLIDGDVEALYANLCRVSSTPEEVILDLALNPNPVGQGGPMTLKVSQRVILNHYTAKRLAALLMATVQRHEQAFGVLETDVRKRVKAQPQQQQG